jgi:hypothetical protein
VLTDRELMVEVGGRILLRELLARFPVALLVNAR